MRKLIFLIIMLASSFGCENQNEKQEKFFDPENLDLLDLANIDGFWNDDAILDTSYYMGANFERHSGYIKGINIYNEDKAVWISVFTTRNTAINAMELRINDVAALIEKGTSDEIKGTWWFLNDGWNSAVFVNQWNTIIEVVISGANNEGIENILYSTANEVIKRVDDLSE